MYNNFLTFDIEEWFDAELVRRKLKIIPEGDNLIDKQVDIFIDICNKFNIKSTCFVLGKLANKNPRIVKKLHLEGHEIASHSFSHKLIYSMTPAEFQKDLHTSIGILEDITGVRIKGFRAPSWSVNSDIAGWFYRVLEEEGLIYSSSVYPAKTFLYGMPESTGQIHKGAGTSVFEIPQQLLNLGLFKTGVSGGFFFRIFPAWFIKKFITSSNLKGRQVFLYFHPWELNSAKYPVNLSLFERILQYYGIKGNPYKIEQMCLAFNSSFVRMDHFIDSIIKYGNY